MGRPAARDTDICTGHGPFPPRANSSSSGNVFVNGKGSIRKDDSYAAHCVGSACHTGAASTGSGTVFINGRDAMRQGDPIDCGSFIAQGSNNVFIGK
jgi:uncharacterized Zn-binding protein involved in type VI secretion